MKDKQQDFRQIVETQGLGETGVIDGRVVTQADAVCDGYFMKDPNVTLDMARNAAIRAEQYIRDLVSKTGIALPPDNFARERLRDLGVNPDTLEIE